MLWKGSSLGFLPRQMAQNLIEAVVFEKLRAEAGWIGYIIYTVPFLYTSPQVK
jgi:hypothetical protein